jgi:hypothetical protein
MAAPTLIMALDTFLCCFISVVIWRAFILTLFPSLVLHTFLTDLFMKSIARADTTPRMALSTNSLAC